MEDLIISYKGAYENKLKLELQLKDLEKSYLKLLVQKCNPSETVCVNCWTIIKFRKGVNDHTYKDEYICKKRNIQYHIIEEMKKIPCEIVTDLPPVAESNLIVEEETSSDTSN
jgi:hypothetical protein